MAAASWVVRRLLAAAPHRGCAHHRGCGARRVPRRWRDALWVPLDLRISSRSMPASWSGRRRPSRAGWPARD